MKRAQTREIGSAFLELNRAPNDLHHVSTSKQFLNKGLRD